MHAGEQRQQQEAVQVSQYKPVNLTGEQPMNW